ncbi:hypothetical protein COY62_03885 [bacterium (Candidatus Howlettbacteria) CG_4_10_14_0_8_um_filter_40_9]|nr:MAG: hypothetical protein COY62_03885 [bacterium (Candidatus Howlettbacteria) CG_4_10_14_0_8_um_filter_40_9]
MKYKHQIFKGILIAGLFAVGLFINASLVFAACSNDIIEDGVNSPAVLASKLNSGNGSNCYQDAASLQAAFRNIMTNFSGSGEAGIALNDMKVANGNIVGGSLSVEKGGSGHWLGIKDASGNNVKLSDGYDKWDFNDQKNGFSPISAGRTTDGGYVYDITGGQGEHYYAGGVGTRFAENSTSWVYIHLRETYSGDTQKTFIRDGKKYIPDFLVMKDCGNVIFTGIRPKATPPPTQLENNRPVAKPVYPANTTIFDANTPTVYLAGKGTDKDGNKTQIAISYRKKKTGASDSTYSTWKYADMSSTDGTQTWSSLGTQGNQRNSRRFSISNGTTYQYKVKAKDAKGATSEWSGIWWFRVKDVTPPPLEEENDTPTISCTSLTAVPSGGMLPLTVSFTANAITNYPNPSLQYIWNFGDNSSEQTTDTNTTTHTYTTNGDIVATVNIKDRDGNIDTVNCPQTARFTVSPWSDGEQGEVAP